MNETDLLRAMASGDEKAVNKIVAQHGDEPVEETIRQHIDATKWAFKLGFRVGQAMALGVSVDDIITKMRSEASDLAAEQLAGGN